MTQSLVGSTRLVLLYNLCMRCLVYRKLQMRPIISRVFCGGILRAVFLSFVSFLRRILPNIHVLRLFLQLFLSRSPLHVAIIRSATGPHRAPWYRPESLDLLPLVIDCNPPHATSMNFSDCVVRLLSPHRDPPAAAVPPAEATATTTTKSVTFFYSN